MTLPKNIEVCPDCGGEGYLEKGFVIKDKLFLCYICGECGKDFKKRDTRFPK
jgi:uncharacterized protein (DUF983 family)